MLDVLKLTKIALQNGQLFTWLLVTGAASLPACIFVISGLLGGGLEGVQIASASSMIFAAAIPSFFLIQSGTNRWGMRRVLTTAACLPLSRESIASARYLSPILGQLAVLVVLVPGVLLVGGGAQDVTAATTCWASGAMAGLMIQALGQITITFFPSSASFVGSAIFWIALLLPKKDLIKALLDAAAAPKTAFVLIATLAAVVSVEVVSFKRKASLV